ncbi:MAG: tetratricopeptide repeat protein [Bacteriovoracaceae bacterium]
MERTVTVPAQNESVSPVEIILKYKFQLILIVLIAILGVVGVGIYKNVQEKKSKEGAEKIFMFRTNQWENFKSGKVSKEELISGLKELHKVSGNNTLYINLLLEVTNFYQEKDTLAELIPLWEELYQEKGKDLYLGYLVSTSLAVAYEEGKQLDKAITTLEALLAGKLKLNHERIYLDLGRLNLMNNNKEKAATHLKYVVENFPNTEYSKIAELYLSKL